MIFHGIGKSAGSVLSDAVPDDGEYFAIQKVQVYGALTVWHVHPRQIELPSSPQIGIGICFIVERTSLEKCPGLRIYSRDGKTETVPAWDRDIGLTHRQQPVSRRNIFPILDEILFVR
jgi:hypothetical protein